MVSFLYSFPPPILIPLFGEVNSLVRSLGTEDRPCNAPIPASNQVYEFIVFSARDISDLKVLDARPQPTPPQDPAIVNVCSWMK